jgi:hypothetical protein
MKLLEKFHKWLRTEPFGSKEEPTLREAQCVVIADEFAIGFAEWICEKAEVLYIKGTMNVTLEIYKKEKGF